MKNLLIVSLFATFLAGTVSAQDPAFKREGTPQQRALKDQLEDKAPPELKLDQWLNTKDNKALKLSDLKGKVVLLDFWGVWCPPCRAAMPHLKELYAKHKKDGLVIIGVHTTNQGERMKTFVEDQEIPWPVGVDMTNKTVRGFRVDSYPDYYLIDRAGKLRVADLQNRDLDRALKILLEEKAK